MSKFSSKKIKLIKFIITAAAAGIAFVILQLLLGVNITGFIKDMFMLKYLPNLGTNSGIGLLFLFGILTSFHCIGMCGGIAISQTIRNTDEQSGENSKHSKLFVPSALYNSGRVISYTIIGAAAGIIGKGVTLGGTLRGVVPIIGGLFMIIMAVNLLGIFPFLRRFNISMPKFIGKKLKAGRSYGPFYIGLLSGLMPCGPLQIVQLYALGTGSVIYGAFSMFVFSLGTVPALFIFGAVNTIINKKHSKLILRISSSLVLILGIAMIGRGLALSGISVNLPLSERSGQQSIALIQDISETSSYKESYTPQAAPSAINDTKKMSESCAHCSTASDNTMNPNSSKVAGNSSIPSAQINEDKNYKVPSEPGVSPDVKPKGTQKIQVIRSKLESDSYPEIVVQEGIPVKWIIIAEKETLNDCNNEIVIPGLNIDKKLALGENVIDFTPEKPGSIPYTCWMGMITSKINVVENLGDKSN